MLRLKNYEVKLQDALMFETDFSSDLVVKQDIASTVMKDLYSFTNINEANIYSKLTLSYETERKDIVAEREVGGIKKVNVDGEAQSGDVFSTINTLCKCNLTPESWAARFIDIKLRNITSVEAFQTIVSQIEQQFNQANPQLNQSKDALKAQLEAAKTKMMANKTPEEISKLERLVEVNTRIKLIQKEVDFYQNEKKIKEDLNTKIASSEAEVKTMEEKLTSVNALTENKKRVESELNSFTTIALDQELNRKVVDLKNNRLNQTVDIMSNIKGRTKQMLKENRGKNEDSKLWGKEIIVMLFAQIALTLALYLLTMNNEIIYFGFLVFITLIVLLFLMNLSKVKLLYETSDDVIKEIMDEKLTYENIALKANNLEDKFLIDAAWVDALKTELNSINVLISSRLSNKRLEDVMLEKQRLEENLNSLKTELTTIEAKSLTSEEYYKKRREVDILKIEKENLEFATKIEPNSEIELISDLLSKLQEEDRPKFSLPLVILNINVLPEGIKQGMMGIIDGLKKLQQIIIVNIIQ